jgi:hypothetical protein
MLVRVFDGTLRPKERIRLMATGSTHLCDQVGVFTPKAVPRDALRAGEVGYIISGIKELQAAKVGDTVTLFDRPTAKAFPGFKEIKSQVFAGLYPVESNQYDSLRDALEKLTLNDASLHYEPEVSQALGFGFRCGFLGLLHMEIVQERLEREFDQDLITTAPTVVYEVLLRDGGVVQVENPAKLPDLSKTEEVREPIITITVFVPQDYLGNVITLCNQKRGNQVDMTYHGRQVQLVYEMPMAEVVMDFFDRLKSVSRGYASLDYEFKEYRAADVVKLDILINGEKVDALSMILHRSNSIYRGRELAAKMRELIPAPDVRCRHSGHHRRQHHRPRERQGDAQGRHRQVLRRRYLAQEETAREAEGRQEAHEAGRVGRDSTGGFPCCVACRQVEGSEPVNFALILLILLLVSGADLGGGCLLFSQAPGGRRQASRGGSSMGPVSSRSFWSSSCCARSSSSRSRFPSGSMIPTLLVGDFILVNKYTYGIRLPVANLKIIDINSPQRGDVMVFRYPEDPSLDYIKRVIGIPGDKVAYQNKKLTINGLPVPTGRG